MNGKLEINISKIISNIELIKGNKQACIAVKGNAYGVGMEIVDYLIKYGYDFFGVSTVEEALFVRSKSKSVKILIFSAIFNEDLKIIRQNDIMFTVYDFELLSKLQKEDKFHLKFDVGMGRLGFNILETPKVIGALSKKDLNVTGIYTHLPEVDNDKKSLEQMKSFEKIISKFKKIQNEIPYIHLYNSIGALKYKTTFDNLVRPGLGIYGYYGNEEDFQKYDFKIKPALKLSAKISLIKDYSGEIGYDGIDTVEGKIATLMIGYHDGITQMYQHYKIPHVGKVVGKICMCQMMIQLDAENIKTKSDFVTIFEKDSIYLLAKHTGTSVYELLSTLSPRIQRIYIENE